MTTIRALTGLRDLQGIEALQTAIWRFSPEAVTPRHVFVAAMKSGGIVLGAFDEGRDLVGFALAFRGEHDGAPCLYSHLMGMHPRHRGQGDGYRLKRSQRTFALEAGLKEILWTFDPLLARNADLNIRRLGAVASEFSSNLYGLDDFGVHGQGLPTDRFLVRWSLDDPATRSAADFDTANVLLGVGRHGEPLSVPTEGPNPRTPRTVAIPRDHEEMRRSNPRLALAWHEAVSQACRGPLDRGWRVEGFQLFDTCGQYLLVPPVRGS